MILVDTSFLIDFFRGVESTKNLIQEESATTAISYHEIMTGLKRKRASEEERFFRRFFGQTRVLSYDTRAADESSEIASKLMAVGREVNTLDILIAGIAAANGITKILTSDSDFREIAKVTNLDVITYRR